jgi:hypothetical protein
MQAVIRAVFKWPLGVGQTNKIETLYLFAINELAGLSINLSRHKLNCEPAHYKVVV